MTIRLRATAAGRLESITLNDRPVKDAASLREHIAAMIRRHDPPSPAVPEVTLDCDYGLSYSETLAVLAIVSAHAPHDGRTHVKFAPRREAKP